MAKHRKPTKNGKRSAAILSGVAITSPLPAVAYAGTNDTGVWDTLAECESSGNWQTDTGNGYQGGLQFAPSTWKAFGGTAFASNAADASKEEQIKVATKVQAAQGWGAWPACTSKLNINDDPPQQTRTEPTPIKKKLEKASSYTVKSGDWLSKIAASNGTTVANIATANDIANVNRIYPGQVLNLSGNSSTPTPVPNSDIAQATPEPTAKYTNVIKEAKQYLGSPYVYGGTSKSGLDCSALVQNAFAAVGKSVPRTSQAQYEASQRVSRADLRPGDLGFIRNNGRVSHVVMYIGNGNIIESSRPGKPVATRPLYSQINAFGRI